MPFRAHIVDVQQIKVFKSDQSYIAVLTCSQIYLLLFFQLKLRIKNVNPGWFVCSETDEVMITAHIGDQLHYIRKRRLNGLPAILNPLRIALREETNQNKI